MGSASQILQKFFMIIIIIIFLLISLHSSHVLVAHASASLDAAEDYFNVHGLQQHLYLMEERDQIQKVSGEDDNDQKEVLIVQKFRALFGLKSLRTKRPSNGGFEYVSPSPSPSPTIQPEVPAPAPLLPIAVHSHHPPPRSNPIPPHHETQNENPDRGRARRILVPVLVSAGAAFLVCVLGLTWFCCKFRKRYKKSAGTMLVFRKRRKKKGKSKYMSSQKPASKVNLNPGLDLFYLNSLGIDLEQQSSCLKQSNETVNTSPSNCSSPSPSYALQERGELNQEVIKSESENASSSSTREITLVHEDGDSVKYESDGVNSSSGDKVVPIACHSSDDESFHSFVDSHSSNVRLSNASAGSLSDTPEIFSPNVAKKATSSPPCSTNLSIPPPPPPPPRPPSVSFSLSNPSSCSTKLPSKASCSSALPNLSSPRISHSSSGLNQTPQSDLVSPRKSSQPPQVPPGIPPPPCPPPFFNKINNSLKGPPPPPAVLPQYTRLGKDGAPLPKLKPLHWDKVRAAPDRCMVWDKLRSSSFE